MSTMFHSSARLREQLSQATSEERLQLTKLIDEARVTSYSAIELQKEACSSAGHSFGNIVRGEGISYLELLEDACENWGLTEVPSRYEKVKGNDYEHHDSSLYKFDLPDNQRNAIVDERTEVLEEMMITKVAMGIFESLPTEQREEVARQIQEQASKMGDVSYQGMASSVAVMAAAKAGGFGTYMLMSSVLSTVSMGTLGFGAYTLASSALSLLLGPAGLLAMGAVGLVKLGSPSKKKVASLGLAFAMISMRLRHQEHMTASA